MKKQFSKDLFVDILNDLQRESDTLSELYDKYRIDYIDCDWIRNDISVIKLLEFIFNAEENHWIEWWCWETDFGRDDNMGQIFDEDDNIIRVETAEELYDFLVSNIEEEEEN